jgi:hypothetical protein
VKDVVPAVVERALALRPDAVTDTFANEARGSLDVHIAAWYAAEGRAEDAIDLLERSMPMWAALMGYPHFPPVLTAAVRNLAAASPDCRAAALRLSETATAEPIALATHGRHARRVLGDLWQATARGALVAPHPDRAAARRAWRHALVVDPQRIAQRSTWRTPLVLARLRRSKV